MNYYRGVSGPGGTPVTLKKYCKEGIVSQCLFPVPKGEMTYDLKNHCGTNRDAAAL